MEYFAYGSNMDVERMREREINFSQRIHATLKGYSLKFNKVASRNPKVGYTNIVPDEKGIVESTLYDISTEDLSKLNKKEGCHNHYSQIKIKVQLDDSQEIAAITYIAQPDKIREGLKPSREYLNHLLAARDILSKSYYKRLEPVETSNFRQSI